MTSSCRPAARLLAGLSLILLAACAAAQDPASPDPATGASCSQPGKNVQCLPFGSIAMDTQSSIKGDPVTLQADIWLNSNMAEQGARWILFSVRNVTADSPQAISISLLKFSTPNGDVVTTRVDHDKANEIDLWVDVLDTPVNTPITLQVQVGASERGAYRLETLVLAFDRGYETLKDPNTGAESSLFSSTLLGVNKETAKLDSAGGASLLQGKKTPGLALPGLVATLALALVLRRRSA